MSGEGLQGRLECSAVGRILISGFVLFVLVGTVVWNLPESKLKRSDSRYVEPVVLALGLDQTWGVFAPEPRKQTFDMEARIIYDDGTREIWTMPKAAEPFVSSFRTYHWQKYSEYARNDMPPATLRPLAGWVARKHNMAGRRPVEVTLVRRWRDLRAPDSESPRPPWQEHAYFTLQVTPEILRGD